MGTAVIARVGEQTPKGLVLPWQVKSQVRDAFAFSFNNHLGTPGRPLSLFSELLRVDERNIGDDRAIWSEACSLIGRRQHSVVDSKGVTSEHSSVGQKETQ